MTTTVRFSNGSQLVIPAVRTADRRWTRNPIPGGDSYGAPFPAGPDTPAFPCPFAGCPTGRDGGSATGWDFSLIDNVIVPQDLAPGNYTISWRYDCEETVQVWANCGDVTIA